MLERQRKLNFSAEMQLQATTECDIYKLHPRLPVVSLISAYTVNISPLNLLSIFCCLFSIYLIR